MKFITPVWNFVKEHLSLALAAGALMVAFLYAGTHFSELLYGALRLAVVVLVAFIAMSVVFKGTLRPYVQSGKFMTDFEALDPKHKAWITVGVLSVIFFVSALCFVHP